MQTSPEAREAIGRDAAASVRARYGLETVLRAWDAAWDADDEPKNPEGDRGPVRKKTWGKST
jgi:hypothetical protein